MNAERLRAGVLISFAVLAVALAVTTLQTAALPDGLWLMLLLLLPLLLPLPGLLRRTRRTYAWATLVLAPYIIYGLTELIANPAARLGAALILFASLASFVSLVGYLRLTRH